MFPAQRGLYGHRSTMNQFAKPGYPYMNFDPFPFTNANLTDMSMNSNFSGDELSKEDTINHMITKKPLSKAERRAEHNAIERARRENLNTKFQSLAQALPNLMNYRRPSKSQIVEKALDWVKQSISREERYRYQILQLQRENKRLLVQCMHQEGTLPPVDTRQQQQQQQQQQHQQHQQQPPRLSLTTTTPLLNPSYPDFTTEHNDGWSNNSHLLNVTPQMTPCTSTEDLSKQEEDDNASSGNEDDLDYRSSPYQVSYLKHVSPQKQHNPQAYMAAGLAYPIDYQSQEAQFDASLAHQWNKYPMDGSSLDSGFSSRNTLQMLS